MTETMRALVLRTAELMEGISVNPNAPWCCHRHNGRWVQLPFGELAGMAYAAYGANVQPGTGAVN